MPQNGHGKHGKQKGKTTVNAMNVMRPDRYAYPENLF